MGQQRDPSQGGKGSGPVAERVLKAAMHEFAKHGFAGARVDRIVNRADVSPRSLYYHFGSKRGLWDAARERLLTQHFEDFVRGVGDKPIADHLMDNIDIALTPRWRQFARMLMWEALDGGTDSAPYPGQAKPGDLIAFRAAQERGEIDPALDANQLTLMFIALTFWPVMFPKSAQRLTGNIPADKLVLERKRLVAELVRHLGPLPDAGDAHSDADGQLPAPPADPGAQLVKVTADADGPDGRASGSKR